ncbi:hypothetical protein ACFP7A_08955 [Sporolactobacillus kofuensis]|uniref:Uncharacterized protein n=1 Tax=Sporolactobacillus kofuensis TaxID=269672 RepID=A0ABW1WDR8_9BACL|nr:hypothetical protein [Sporolactobacillus kofuensis]MCO7176148.1 hypothetical protein [Sporolactobacillus kofuensis]
MDKNQMVGKLNELQHQLSRMTDSVEREKLQLEINALEQALVGKIRAQNDALSGGLRDRITGGRIRKRSSAKLP